MLVEMGPEAKMFAVHIVWRKLKENVVLSFFFLMKCEVWPRLRLLWMRLSRQSLSEWHSALGVCGRQGHSTGGDQNYSWRGFGLIWTQKHGWNLDNKD